MAVPPLRINPDIGIPDLVRRLADDGKRLISDELRLAKLETKESLHRAGRGAIWMAAAFAIAIVMMVAFTLFGATLIGRLASGHMWVGAIAIGLIELSLAALLMKKGVATLAEPSYTLEETRESVREVVRGS
jgi:hypothetical protein